jgi:hypothetical protein
MRLARTTSPLPRESGRQESNLRSPAPEAGGVAVSPTARRCQWEEGLASLNRGGALLERFPEPSVARQHACQPPSWTARGMPCPLSDAGWHEAPAAGLEPALSRLTVARLTDSTTPERNGRRGSRTPKAFIRPTRFRDGVPRPWQSFPLVELVLRGVLGFLTRRWVCGGRRDSVDHTARRLEHGQRSRRRRSPASPGGSRRRSGKRVAPAGLEPATPRVRAGSSASLSYGASNVAGRNRTCGAPRFRRALYRAELRPRGWARLESNQRPLVCKTSALAC